MKAPLVVELASGTPAEAETRDELLALIEHHGLERWQFTDTVVIEEGAIPHSHPVLTLGTTNRGPSQLASYLHEQLHWCTFTFDDHAVSALHDVLCERYPVVPVGDLEGGPGGELSTRLHLIVCWLEWDGLRQLLGADEARRIVSRVAERIYPWVYRTVLEDDDELGRLLASYGIRV